MSPMQRQVGGTVEVRRADQIPAMHPIRDEPPGSAPELTVLVPLSGPHRLHWLQEAIESVPMDHPAVRALHVVHSGGTWDWADGLRRQLESQPKARVFEFGDRLDFCASMNRVMSTARTKWALLLPDDDAILKDNLRAALDVAGDALSSDAGLVAFGWCYLMDGRYRAARIRSLALSELYRYTPKFSSTLIHVAHFKALGGFDSSFGGYADTVTFARLVHAHGAWKSNVPAGVYRMHEGQVSAASRLQMYAAYLEPSVAALQALCSEAGQREAIAQKLRAHATSPHFIAPAGWRRRLHALRGHSRPPGSTKAVRLERWGFAAQD